MKFLTRPMLPQQITAAVLLLLLLQPLPANALDTVLAKGGVKHEGRFTGYKNGSLNLLLSDGKKLQVSATTVDQLSVEPPLRVTVKPATKKAIEDVRLVSFDGTNFLFSGSTGNAVKLSKNDITYIDVKLDLRSLKDPEAAVAQTETDITKLVQKGVVTVIHFDMPTIASSMRQGSYAEAIAHGSHGQVVVKRIEIPTFDSPAALQYQIKSAPQFWFYSKSGQLVTKLVDRFTDGDIDTAVKSAKKQ